MTRSKLAVGDALTRAWSIAAPDYQLERNDTLVGANRWLAVTNAPALSGLQHIVTNPAPGAIEFYRLRRP